MKKLTILIMAAFAALTFGLATSCDRNDDQDQLPDWWFEPDSSSTVTDEYPVPAEAGNNVVAHRGGAAETGEQSNPDNSLAALRYAISLGVYASECDIYWTKDNDVIVAHADADCKVNGLHPWEHTTDEIRKAGNLANGEVVPTLGDVLDVVMKESSCTRLWLDIKNITSPSTLTEYPIKAVKRACEIIKEKKAVNFVEFICTSNSRVMSGAVLYAEEAGIDIGWMANVPVSTYISKGYTWANLNSSYMVRDGGKRTVEEFLKAGIAFSVFVVDDESMMDYYLTYGDKIKAITTNYPKKLLEKAAASK